MAKRLYIFFGGLSIFITWVLYGPLGDNLPPSLPNFYWGPKAQENQPEDTTIRPFKINIEEKVLTDLKKRLEIEVSEDRLTPPLEGIGFQYGFNSKELKKITTHWLKKYEWRSREKLLNKYPQFKTSIAGIDIHFQHVKSLSKKYYKNTRPLLLLHGWPGSFIEFQDVIPHLTNPANSDTNFELIIPSLPGYGFSERSHRPGLGPAEAAQIFLKLMNRLGHDQFYVQGGDWGAIIATHMASLYPDNVVGLHLNLCLSQHSRTYFRILVGSIYPSLFMPTENIQRLYPLSTRIANLIEETGYLHLQATKPDTVGAALTNSPSGLAAYILEKFSTATNLAWREREDGGLLPHYDIDDLLDNIMIYWVTNSITSSFRFHSECFSRRTRAYGINNVPVEVPTGCLFLPHEPLNSQTEYFLQDKYPQLISFTRGSKGGHFAAFEVPEVLSNDVINFFNLVEKSAASKFTEKPKPSEAKQ